MSDPSTKTTIITKGTAISLGVVLILMGAVYAYAKLEAKTDQNTVNIATLVERIDKQVEVDEKQNGINQELNENIITLKAQLDSLKTGSTIVSVAPSRPTPPVVVVSSQDGQIQPQSPPQESEPQPEPAPPQTPQQPTLVGFLQDAPCGLLGIFCN